MLWVWMSLDLVYWAIHCSVMDTPQIQSAPWHPRPRHDDTIRGVTLPAFKREGKLPGAKSDQVIFCWFPGRGRKGRSMIKDVPTNNLKRITVHLPWNIKKGSNLRGFGHFQNTIKMVFKTQLVRDHPKATSAQKQKGNEAKSSIFLGVPRKHDLNYI